MVGLSIVKDSFPCPYECLDRNEEFYFKIEGCENFYHRQIFDIERIKLRTQR